MKRSGLFVLAMTLCLLTSTVAFAQSQEDSKKNPSCKNCGMNRQQFAHSRMYVEYDDGTVMGTCSIHCLAVDLALNIDKTPKTIEVGDYNTKSLIDAEKAVWVIGGSRPGVMTKRAKWAFAEKAAAEAFIKENQGRAATFDEAMKATYEDMNDDTKMIRERNK